MTSIRSVPAVVGVCVLLLVAGVAVPSSGTLAATTADNDTAGAAVATGLQAQGEDLGRPLGATDRQFDRAFYLRIARFAAAYNQEHPDPGTFGGVVTGNLINLHIVGADGEKAVVSFRLTEDNRIKDLRVGARSDARIRMEMDVETFNRLAAADRPGAAFDRALDSGEVRISGRGLFSGMAWRVLNLLRGLLGGG